MLLTSLWVTTSNGRGTWRTGPDQIMTNSKKLVCIAALIAISMITKADEKVAVQLEGISDGDTIYVRAPSTRARFVVRLAAIDAPEKSQQYGSESKATLGQLLRGSQHLVLEDHGRDRYGRMVAIVQDDHERNINLEMVARGAAWVFPQYASRPEHSSVYPDLMEAEQNARSRRVGLWSNSTAIEPWRYRQMN